MDQEKQENNQTLSKSDNFSHVNRQAELKTQPSLTPKVCIDDVKDSDQVKKKKSWFEKSAVTINHYITLVLLGTISWGLLWCAFGVEWRWDGQWFRIAVVAVVAWGSGVILERVTTLPPLLAALITGMLARHLEILDMRDHIHIDGFLRKIYPVIILGKGSLAWNLNYMKRNWRQVLALGTVPWTIEVVVLAICTHLFLGFPWIWGFLLGSIYASVSCPVVMPLVQKHGKNGRPTVIWPQLICTAGGLDTTLSVGVYGVIFTFMFYEAHESYRYAKAVLGIFVGVALGVGWGSLAKLVPDSQDYYVTELRVLFVLLGGLFVSFFTSVIGWGGTGGVAVLACNATAASHWEKKGWKLNQNPASTAYRVIWSFCEPLLFAYTGTFFVMHSSITNTMLIGLGILIICLIVRLGAAFLLCGNLNVKERIFVCCTWIPKSIVEAVLCPVAINTILMSEEPNRHELIYAEQLMQLIVQAILITTPIAFLLTNLLGPMLIRDKQRDCENDTESSKRKSVEISRCEVIKL